MKEFHHLNHFGHHLEEMIAKKTGDLVDMSARLASKSTEFIVDTAAKAVDVVGDAAEAAADATLHAGQHVAHASSGAAKEIGRTMTHRNTADDGIVRGTRSRGHDATGR